MRPGEWVTDAEYEDMNARGAAEDAYYGSLDSVDWDVVEAHRRFEHMPLTLAAELKRIDRNRRMRWAYRPDRED